MQKIKILLLSSAPNVHTKRWVRGLSEKGVEILLFSFEDADNDYYKAMDGVQVVSFGMKAHNLFGKLKYLGVVHKLKRCIKEFRPDILHAHYATGYGLVGALSGFSPYIISVWGSDVYDFPHTFPFARYILQWNLRKADMILSTSRAMARETARYTSRKIEITPFGVDTAKFKKKEGLQPQNEFVVGCVKTLDPTYGIDILIKACKKVVENNPSLPFRLMIFGKGNHREAYLRLSRELGMERIVSFPGFIDNDLLPDVYNSFSVAVFPSRSESFGVAAVEAMACQCPVVCSDADGFAEVVKDRETGFLVPKENVEATAAAIQRFIENPSLRETMGKAGRARVEEFYVWDKNVDLMLDIYRQRISSNKTALRKKRIDSQGL